MGIGFSPMNTPTTISFAKSTAGTSANFLEYGAIPCFQNACHCSACRNAAMRGSATPHWLPRHWSRSAIASAKDFISKPFNITTVASVAERTIGEKRLLDKLVSSGDLAGSLGRLNTELFRKLQEISVLQALSAEIDSLYDNKKIYERIVEMGSRIITAKEISFGIIENGSVKIKSSLGISAKKIPLTNTLFERVVESRTHCIATYGETDPHTGKPLNAPFFSIPLSMHDEVFAVLNFSNKADGTGFTEDEIALSLTFAKKAAQRIENNALYEVFYHNLVNTLKSLVISIEARDPYTQLHSERVTQYACR